MVSRQKWLLASEEGRNAAGRAYIGARRGVSSFPFVLFVGGRLPALFGIVGPCRGRTLKILKFENSENSLNVFHFSMVPNHFDMFLS